MMIRVTYAELSWGNLCGTRLISDLVSIVVSHGLVFSTVKKVLQESSKIKNHLVFHVLTHIAILSLMHNVPKWSDTLLQQMLQDF